MKTIDFKYRDFYRVRVDLHLVEAWEGDRDVLGGFRKVTVLDDVEYKAMWFEPAEGTSMQVHFGSQEIMNKVKMAARDAFYEENYTTIHDDWASEPRETPAYDVYLE